MIETIAALVLALIIAVKVGNLWHIAAWSILGWTLLLRTTISTERGLRLFDPTFRFASSLLKASTRTERAPGPMANLPYDLALGFERLFYQVSALCLLTIGSIVSKFIATVWTFFTDFGESVQAITENWKRAILCIDLGQPLEFVPGYAERFLPPSPLAVYGGRGPRIDDVRPRTLWRELHDGRQFLISAIGLAVAVIIYAFRNRVPWHDLAALWLERLSPLSWVDPYSFVMGLITLIVVFLGIPAAVGFIINSPLRVALYLPAITYRFALKATVVTYSPLLWVVTRSIPRGNVRAQLENILESRFAAFLRVISWVAITLFLGKIVLYSLWESVKERWNAIPFTPVLNIYLIPHQLPLWHYTIALNAALTIALYFVADHWLLKMRSDEPTDKRRISRVLAAYTFVSGVLGLYNTLCNIALSAKYADRIRFPEVGPMFPWP